jgi:RNA polymerase sigma-70 factor (ECF subfamily)
MGDREADRMLVERVQAGDKQAFGLLVTKYQRKLARLVSRMVRDPAEVEDIVQDSFIRAYKALPNFRNDSAFYTWLYRIGVNTAKNWLVTHGKRAQLTSTTDGDEAENYDEPELLRNNETPERLLMTKQIGETVNAVVETLPEDLRIALTLREMEGLSYEEIADVMDCPIGTVRSRIFRARDAIALKLRPLLDTTAEKRW